MENNGIVQTKIKFSRPLEGNAPETGSIRENLKNPEALMEVEFSFIS